MRRSKSADPSVRRLQSLGSIQLQGRINRLGKANFDELSEDQIKTRVGRLLDGFAHKAMFLSTDKVFRARICNSANGFENATELWYPPASLVRPGRFNAANSPAFYCSTTINAAIWEVRPKAGDFVQVLICGTEQPTNEMKLVHVGVDRFSGANRADPNYPDLRSDLSFMQQLKQSRLDRKWLRIDKALADLATTPSDERNGIHKATRAFGDIFLNMPDTVGLLYPSVATDLAAFNIRLNADAADYLLFPAEVWLFEVLGFEDEYRATTDDKMGGIVTKPIKRSDRIEEGEIRWREGKISDTALDFSEMSRRVAEHRDVRTLAK